ncbi:high choriolytic enzyme 1-like [Acipenser oxyrinchus oxyrinchus]|uniref:Metalloendopeptidase n=1 Tax=Acipenser oxyrinchus oxyrinchus TaxID=40147 RepID=A0AAD8G6D8_ACIOX|nr:high choriolytic enzyme 1-like [Acipenser oxyrinchus oxyrinchus]
MIMKSLICVIVLGFIAQVYALPIRNENSGAKNMDLEPWVVMDKIIQANANIAPVTRHYSIKFGDIAFPNSRTAMFCPMNDCFWPRSDDGFVYIPYKISTEYSPSEQAVITDAMSEYAKVSCIRFVSYTNEMDYLHVQPLDGCWSYFGRKGGEQPISFSRIGCLYKGIIIHELMHTLGFYHEHNRSDREDYITIMMDNIQPGREDQFQILNTNNLGTKYDYGSIMHYGRYSFSKNPMLPTIVTKPDNVLIGQRTRLSSIDILRVNRLHSCDATTNPMPVSTTRPTTTTTTTTTMKQPSVANYWRQYLGQPLIQLGNDCGGLLESSSGEIFSPDYPNLYPNNKDCQWRISSTSRVQLIFQSLDVEFSVNCLWDYIEVHDGPSIDSRTVGPRLCGSYIPKPLTSSGKDLLIVFHSDENVASKGFHISYTLYL